MPEELYSKSKDLGYDYLKDRGLVTTIDPNDPNQDISPLNNTEYNYYTESLFILRLRDFFPEKDEKNYIYI